MAGRGNRREGNGFDDWGGYMAAKVSKLQDQFKEEANLAGTKVSDIFQGIAIFVNGYTNPSSEDLKRLMMTHGGTYHHYQTRKTTHIIASNLPEAKIKQMKGSEKIIKPDWIVQSIKAGKVLDYKPFLLVIPRTTPQLDFVPITIPVIPVEKVVETSAIFSSSGETSAPDIGKCTTQNRAFKAGDENFLSEYYNRSRLHHISSMGALFKRRIADLRADGIPAHFPGLKDLEEWQALHSSSSSKKEKLLQGNESVIMHIDMDCFFVSVGLRNRAELRTFPVAVTHAKVDTKPGVRPGADRQYEFQKYKEKLVKTWEDKHCDGGRKSTEPDAIAVNVDDYFPRLSNVDESCSMSEIASCNYLARAAGINNGMFMGAALKLCPNLKTIPYDFEAYKEVSFALYDIMARYTLEIEAVSCDEMYVDITQVLRNTASSPEDFVTHVRSVIHEKTGCPASAGMGPNQLIARLATKKAKPNGQYWVKSDEVSAFMLDQDVEDLPGVGRSLAYRLAALNVKTCAEMQKLSLSQLQKEVGPKVGQTLYSHCRGQDQRQLQTGHVRKSVSAEVNYGIRLSNDQEVYKFVSELAQEVAQRLEDNSVRGQSLTLKLKIRAKGAPLETAKYMGHGVCDNVSKSILMPTPTRDVHVLQRESLALLRQMKPEPSDIRGVGIQLSKLKAEITKVSPGKSAGTAQGGQSLLNYFVSGDGGQRVKEKVMPAQASTCMAGMRIPRNPFEAAKRKFNTSPAKNLTLPAVSQIDWEVLRELPPEIRADIQTEYQRQGIDLAASTSISSRMSNNGSEHITEVDPDFLNALPLDVRQELERDLGLGQAAKKLRSTSVLGTTSPSKGSGPGRCRSFPSKTSTALNKRARTGTIRTDNIKKTKQRLAVLPNGFRITTKRGQSPASPIKVPAQACEDILPKEVPTTPKRPSLCGAETLPEIRLMLHKWLTTPNSHPLEEDVSIVTQFLVELIHQPNLELLVQVIQAFRRLVKKAEDPDWQSASERVLQLVQDAMIKRYGSPLFLEPVS